MSFVQLIMVKIFQVFPCFYMALIKRTTDFLAELWYVTESEVDTEVERNLSCHKMLHDA